MRSLLSSVAVAVVVMACSPAEIADPIAVSCTGSPSGGCACGITKGTRSGTCPANDAAALVCCATRGWSEGASPGDAGVYVQQKCACEPAADLDGGGASCPDDRVKVDRCS